MLAVVGVDDSSIQADLQLEMLWRCSTFIRWTDELSKWLCHDDSTINIVL